MMKKIIFVIIGLAVLIAIGFFVYQNYIAESSKIDQTENQVPPQEELGNPPEIPDEIGNGSDE